MTYAEIGVTTNFSFLRGASHPQEYVRQAADYGLTAIGVADTQYARRRRARLFRALATRSSTYKPKLLVGARLVFIDGTPDILVYPRDRAAYGRLCRLLSRGKLKAEKGECLLTLADLKEFSEGQLLVLMPSYRFIAGQRRKHLEQPGHLAGRGRLSGSEPFLSRRRRAPPGAVEARGRHGARAADRDQ